MRAVPNQNALVRTRSTYSRRMTAKIFFQFITASLDGPRFLKSRCPDCGEIDFLELRLSVRERRHVVVIDRPAKKLPTVGARRERDDVGTVDRFAPGHSWESGNFIGGCLHRDTQLSLGVPPFEVLQIALKNFLGLGDETDLVAELFRLLEYVSRENDCLSFGSTV